MLTSESSLNRSTHVIEDPQTQQLRLLTPMEAERIQGFDDNWTNTGMPEKFRYFCMGNALVVGLITRMGTYLNTIFDRETTMVADDVKPRGNVVSRVLFYLDSISTLTIILPVTKEYSRFFITGTPLAF